MPPLKILVLHGHGMTGEQMRSKLGFLRSETKKLVEWYFADGPVALSGQAVAATMAARRAAAGMEPLPDRTPTAEGESRDGDPVRADNTVFSWFRFDGHTPTGEIRYTHMQEAFDAIRASVERDGPFDGVFGFSQGAVIASLWMALQQRLVLSMPPALDVDVPQPQKPLRVGVFCSGLLPSDPAWKSAILDVPHPATAIRTLHCYGEGDEIILPRLSEELRCVPLFSAAPAVASPPLTHEGGHVVAGAFRKPLKAFFTSAIDTT
jgi:hypothetical protein